jgi:hypothetical protein
MIHSSVTLSKSARLCREMAAECLTEEAREALLDAADSMDGGAERNDRPQRPDPPVFRWTA